MDEPACPGCRELLQRVAELEAQVAELTRRLDDALRAGKRQAAPFRKGPPKPDPKTPGRKSGVFLLSWKSAFRKKKLRFARVSCGRRLP